MTVSLKTKRLLIRDFTPDDWSDLMEVAMDKSVSEYAAYDPPFPTSEKEVKDIIEHPAKTSQFFAICETASGKVIGYISLNGENHEERNLVYTLHSRFQGKGLAIEASIAVIDYAFKNLNLKKITSSTANVNYASVRVLLYLGFIKTGEHTASFSLNPEGKPVEFSGSSYVLEKDSWINTQLLI
ncbi:MAG TPA: GNAT family N-acetyltransferase [Dehalococcoidales bacterium]|nr:GNAT family N-acetyltransferase [Dehalococcoidales bacterium]